MMNSKYTEEELRAKARVVLRNSYQEGTSALIAILADHFDLDHQEVVKLIQELAK